MDSTLALAITKVILEEMGKVEETSKDVPEITKPTKITKTTKRKTTVKKQEKEINGNNSNC